jgi:radical SAM protein with 4Fe4S-binding SPASM domain
VLALKKSGLDYFDLSLKGYSSSDFIDNTGVDAYQLVMKSISNLSDLEIPFAVSFVLNRTNIKNYLGGIRDAIKCGAQEIHLSYEFDFSTIEETTTNSSNDRAIISLVDNFQRSYNDLCNITSNKFLLHQTLPLCVYDDEIINSMLQKQQIVTSCMVNSQNGIVFDSHGNLIPCNALYSFPYGKFGEDFMSATEFFEFWSSDIQAKNRAKLAAPKSNACSICECASICMGGCLANWLSINSLKTLLQNKIEYESSQKL